MTETTTTTPTPPVCGSCGQRPAVHTIWTRQRGYLAVCSDCAMGF